MQMSHLLLVIVCPAIFITVVGGCATHTGPDNSYIVDQPPDATTKVRTSGIETPDILACANELSADLLATNGIGNASPYCRIVLRQVTNLSDSRVDAEIISDQIRHHLIQSCGGRVRFVQRTRGGDMAEFDSAVLAEREMKDQGMVDSGERKALAGADFFLTGTLRSHTVVTQGGRDETTFIFYILEDAETGEIVWENSYGPIRKVAAKGRAYR